MFKYKAFKKLKAWYQAAAVWAYTRPEPTPEWEALFESYEKGVNKVTNITPNKWINNIDNALSSIPAPAWMYKLEKAQNDIKKS